MKALMKTLMKTRLGLSQAKRASASREPCPDWVDPGPKMNDVFVRHISPFTQLLNLESRFLIERILTFTIKDLIVLFAHASCHIEL